MGTSAQAAADWTPDSALRDGRITAHLASSIDAWLVEWVASPPSTALSADLAWAKRHVAENNLSWYAPGLVLTLPQRAAAAIGSTMTGYAGPTLRDEDDIILASIARTALETLWSKLCQIFEESHDVQPSEKSADFSLNKAARFSRRIREGLSLEIYVTRDRLAKARKKQATRLRRPGPLDQRSRAINLQAISLSLLAGEARIGLQDMKALARGDVIILDRAVNQDLVLAYRGNSLQPLTCRIERAAHAHRLRITQAS